jgi:deferrochelatase/peroxidase EfeB
MSPQIPPSPQPDLADIQGFIVRGYTHPCSVHLLFKFNRGTSDVAGAPAAIKTFFKALLPYLRNAEDWGALKPDMMLNIGLTAEGIAIVRPDLNVYNSNFPTTFKLGPWDPNVAQSALGDYGDGDPSKWWNNNFENGDIHCVVHTYAMNPEAQEQIVKIVTHAAKSSKGAVTELLPLKSKTGRLEQYPLIPSDYIHFRYRDSIDEPDLNDNPAGTDQADLNNFLIGYSTAPDPIPGPLSGPEAIFAKNGCYNAFRILYQDVETFDNFLEQQAEKINPNEKDNTVEWLAAKMCGRWRQGSPLVLSPDEPQHSTSKATDFGYEADTLGLKCPFAAHTRVANARNEGVNPPAGNIVPRIIRRGMAYGPPLLKDNADADRGLIGLFLCGDISGQFETLYAWMNTNNFSDVYSPNFNTQDALVANRGLNQAENNIDPTLTIPMANGKNLIVPVPGTIANDALPQFVVTRGTAYFLLPSISSIKEIAEGAI